jgi:hypothetical protein
LIPSANDEMSQAAGNGIHSFSLVRGGFLSMDGGSRFIISVLGGLTAAAAQVQSDRRKKKK